MRVFLTTMTTLALMAAPGMAQSPASKPVDAAPLRPKLPMAELARKLSRGRFATSDPDLALLHSGGCDKVLKAAGYQPTQQNCANLRHLMATYR